MLPSDPHLSVPLLITVFPPTLCLFRGLSVPDPKYHLDQEVAAGVVGTVMTPGYS